ncbi:T9SS type A sorting domain-containing protein [Ekhidna sp.]
MIRNLGSILFILITITVSGQSSSQQGQWTTNATWSGGSFPGTLTVNAGDDNLAFSNQTISVDHYVTVGTSSSDRIDMSFANSNSNGSLSIEDNDTLIVYGDWSFANKSMDLNIGANSVVIILGDASFSNKIDIATSGTLVVSGNFGKSGSQGSYSGGGAVYAGSYSGSADAFIPGETGTGGDQQQTIDDLSDDGFSPIEEFINGDGATPLPVELLYFRTSSIDKNVSIAWATASEINNDYFVLERSEDGENFYEIGQISGNGNTNKVIDYQYIDKFVYASVEYYRLKQVDFDGAFEFFEITRVNTSVQKESIEIKSYPTVIKDGTLNISSSQPFQIQEIAFYSLSGGTAGSLREDTKQENPLNYLVNVNNLTKGIYLLKVITSEGDQLTNRIIVK